jgi:hypothetical protein
LFVHRAGILVCSRRVLVGWYVRCFCHGCQVGTVITQHRDFEDRLKNGLRPRFPACAAFGNVSQLTTEGVSATVVMCNNF